MFSCRNTAAAITVSTYLLFLHSLAAQVQSPPQMQDKPTFKSKYFAAADSLKKTQRLSSVIVDHDQEVLETVYTNVKPRFEKKGFTSDDSAAAVINAWYTLRYSKHIAPDTGVTTSSLNGYLTTAQPIVIDSAPRGAEVKLIPDEGLGPIKTRNTVFLKPGTQFTLHFSLPGFADYSDTITAVETNSLI